jgi:hypothetical protein
MALRPIRVLSHQTDALFEASAMNISFGQEERVH